MTVTNPTAYTKDSDAWVHSTFIVSLGDDGNGNPVDYHTYLQIIQNNQQDELYNGGTGDRSIETHMQAVIAQAGDLNGPLPVYFSHRKCRDTSLGGNDAINCYYQYNETDDPPHPFTMSETTKSTGLGRVYSETIDDHQQILYLTFGLPVFNNLSEFYTAALNKDIADLTNSGASTSILQKLQAMSRAIVTTIVNIPSLPWLYYILPGWAHKVANIPITKYYDFSSRMDLYYKYVQSMLNQLSVNMGFMNDANLLQSNPATTGTGGVLNDQTYSEQATAAAQQTGDAGVPDIFRTFHMDILQIMNRRASFMVATTGYDNIPPMLSTDTVVAALTNNANGLANNGSTQTNYDISMLTTIQGLTQGFSSTIYNALFYIGFRVEKSTDSSESIANQLGPSEIAGFINSKSQSARDAKFKAMYGRTGYAALDAIGNLVGSLANEISNAVDNTKGIEGLTALATGSGMIDIPDIWKDSSVSKSYSFNLRLRSPYGDPLSIIQSVYTPLLLILAGAMPRATGNSSYSTPFICRAFCKGMFAVPLGMIESVSIRRGSDVNGWTYQRLPTCVDVNFTIKDLSPCMYMAMANLTSLDQTDVFNAIFGANSNFQEYLLTLSGIGLAERLNYICNLRRKTQILIQTALEWRLNPFYWDSVLGNTLPMKLITSIIPTTKLPQN